VPAERLLAGGIADAEIAGRAVIVGNSASGTSKVVRTVSGEGVSGSLFQALAIDSIITGRVLSRPPLADHLEMIFGLALGLILVAVSPRLRLRLNSLGLVSGGVTLGLPLTAGLAMATGGVLVDASFPLLVGLSLSGLVALECLGEEQAIRRHQKALLDRRDAYMRQVVDSSFDAIVTVDASARILTANAGAADLFGVPKEWLPGMPIGDMLAGSWAATLREAPERQLEQAVRSRGVIHATVVGTKEHTVETEMTVAETATETHRVFVIVLRDISVRRRAERAAARAGERLRAGVEAITDGFVLFGGDRRLIICNARYRNMLGEAGAMAIPGADFDTVMESYAATAGAPMDAVGRAGDWVAERADAFLRAEAPREQHCLDGRWFRVDERPTVEGGMVGVYTDISVLKNRETELDEARLRAEAASSAKSEFLANMSHELRTPLNAVIGFADLMKREIFGPVGSPHYRDYAGHIIDSGSKLLSMIEDILDFSRSEHAGGEAGDVSTQINQVVLEVLRDIAPAALNRKISVVPELDHRVPPLKVDAAILYQILQNLVSNAIKFSPDEAEIRVIAFVDEDGGAGLSVDDRGPGIPPDLVDKVTQPFWQREGPLVRSHGGVGLGLAIVKSHVDALGGTLRFEGRVGGGTRVTVLFPPSRTAIDG
jgi:PAS domain S-box-containing protein